MDLSNSEKNGILLMEDPLEREWVPHFFVLTETKMSYTEVHQEENEPEEADEDQSDLSLKEVLYYFYLIVLFFSWWFVFQKGVPDCDLHLNEEWFHSRLTGGRSRAEKLLLQYGPSLGDGAFLVRKSDNFVGDFSLSFWYCFVVNFHFWLFAFFYYY